MAPFRQTERAALLLTQPSAQRGPASALLPNGRLPRFGRGLLCAFAISEVACVASDKHMYLLDPSGRYLTSAIDAAPTADAQQPIGRVYPLVPSDLPRKFSDQYAPLAVGGYAAAAGAPLDGTLVRLPLRSHALAAGSRFSNKFWSAARMRTLLGALEKQATPALLGLETLETLECSGVYPAPTRQLDAPPQTIPSARRAAARRPRPRRRLAAHDNLLLLWLELYEAGGELRRRCHYRHPRAQRSSCRRA